MGLNEETRAIRGVGSIGLDLGRVGVQFRAPDKAGRLALRENGVKETAKDVDAIALTDFGERGMIGQGFVEWSCVDSVTLP